MAVNRNSNRKSIKHQNRIRIGIPNRIPFKSKERTRSFTHHQSKLTPTPKRATVGHDRGLFDDVAKAVDQFPTQSV